MARWLTSDGSNVKEVKKASVSIDGLNHGILRAVVAENGTWRQFYPSAAPIDPVDPSIVWDTTPLTVTQSAVDPADSSATISFYRDSGAYTYTNHPSPDGGGLYMNPAVTGAGQYLIKADQVSGAALTGTLGVWIDLFDQASQLFGLNQTVIGSGTALADISIAQDDGGGAPVADSIVVKPVTFNSTVTDGGTSIVWTTVQRDLVELKEATDADCILTFNPIGQASGDADTSGSFTENWHNQSPFCPDPENYTVTTTLVSGDAPIGSALATPLTLDATRQWTLLATEGEDLSCELDVDVDDGAFNVVKRVTMHSARTIPDSTLVWSADPSWTQLDLVEGGGTAAVIIAVKTDGRAESTSDHMPQTNEEDWHSEAPTPSDPQNYETQLQLLTGNAANVSGILNTWFTLPNIAWGVSMSTGEIGVWTFNLMIRKIGGSLVAKKVTVRLNRE